VFFFTGGGSWVFEFPTAFLAAEPPPTQFSFNDQRDASELYNLVADRNELHDLAAKRPDMAKKMEAQWLAWWKDCTGEEWTGKAPKEVKDE